MKILIDRIMSKVNEQKFDSKYIDIDKIREIIEAELTAVKGVDELIMDGLKRLHRNSETQPHECSQEGYEYGLEDAMKLVEEIQKSLKQTPVAEEYHCTECGGNAYEGYIVPEGNCKIDKGERLCKKCMEKRNPDFIEQDERLKDSQPKEVERCKKCGLIITACMCNMKYMDFRL